MPGYVAAPPIAHMARLLIAQWCSGFRYPPFQPEQWNLISWLCGSVIATYLPTLPIAHMSRLSIAQWCNAFRVSSVLARTMV